jgi:hypothetical protein
MSSEGSLPLGKAREQGMGVYSSHRGITDFFGLSIGQRRVSTGQGCLRGRIFNLKACCTVQGPAGGQGNLFSRYRGRK